MNEKITTSSGNVFKDLGFDTQEAENFNVSQSRISEIFQGKVDRLSAHCAPIAHTKRWPKSLTPRSHSSALMLSL